MARLERIDPTTEWLNYIRPEGLVLGANVLREHALEPERQGALDTEAAAAAIGLPHDAAVEEDPYFTLAEPWPLFRNVLGWNAGLVAGAPGGPSVADRLTVPVPEHDTHLAPDWAVLWRGEPPEDGPPAQALILLRPDLDADERGAEEGWEASPHQRLERLVRETGVEVGVLVARNALRLLHAPRGETAGWMTWPLAPLGRTEGRPMLAGLKVALGARRFHVGPAELRLRPLLKASREAQNEVSERLSGQVLGALHELLRGLHRADPERVEILAREAPAQLYEGLLTTLMRLVFLLYAEDRDLLPTSRDEGARTLWQSGYSVATLFARLEDAVARHPDTVDERRGGWGQLLAVFRLVHRGYDGWIKGRGGKLFDPDAFPFLEGRGPGEPPVVLPVSDGCIHRILEGLMTLPNKEGVRERLSYRSLDVEQIGSVYETVMGFTAHSATERMIAVADEKGLPIFLGLQSLLATSPANRAKWLKDRAVKLTPKQAAGVKAARDEPALLTALAEGQARRHRVGAIDLRGSPGQVPIAPGAPYLQPTDERRRSGSHYTPRALTHPIVTHALAPAFERIGDHATPEDVLGLKVCDPACGSGAFLVEACRQLGERLEAAWARHPGLKPTVPEDEDDATHARRLVAQRCLYGVDRNPMAVDLARLSLWLATLAAEHEFTFLDHALKAGDSLVGLTREQIGHMTWAPGRGSPLLAGHVRERMEAWRTARREIRTAPDTVTRAEQEVRLAGAERNLSTVREVADALVATFFAGDKAKARMKALKQFQADFDDRSLGSGFDLAARMARALREGERPVTPFHWEVEFPEVWDGDAPGFDAVVGNPPFAGKNTISDGNGPLYIPWLQHLHEGAHGNADLVAHFFRRAFGMLREGGAFGLIATNTIGQGDTRATGLAAILAEGGAILRASKRRRWPGAAAVVVSVVHVRRGAARSPVLDGRQVGRVSAYLVPGDYDASPHPLAENAGRAFIGSYLLGMGFTFDDAAAAKGEAESLAEMDRLIAKNPRNAERIKPYIGGEEVNTSPTHAHHRHAIDFEDFPLRRDDGLKPWHRMEPKERDAALRAGVVPGDYPHPVAMDWPDLVEIVGARVRPQRQALPNNADGRRRRQYWWKYGRIPFSLIAKLARYDEAIVRSLTSAHFPTFASVSSTNLIDQTLVVFLPPQTSRVAALCSRTHEIWARYFGADFGSTGRYNIADCFETFPFPPGYEADPALEEAGRAYHDHRAALMVESERGMTKTYNDFHDPRLRPPKHAKLQALRDLHDAMDRAVLRAYGWDDLASRAEPRHLGEDDPEHTYQGRLHWPSEFRDEVLRRLLALNAERHREEQSAARAAQ